MPSSFKRSAAATQFVCDLCFGAKPVADRVVGEILTVCKACSTSRSIASEPELRAKRDAERAAIRADEIAEEADFFSFGTNDLTQMTFGFSRDDVESRMMPAYLEQGLLKRNPFETIDRGGVGELVKMGAARGRSVKKGLKLGVCGEHGGDPESIQLFYEAGLDYVSCSPFRVPIARLAAAQAVIGGSKSDTK